MSWLNTLFGRNSARKMGPSAGRIPSNDAGWLSYQDQCWAAYYAEPYTDEQIQTLGLFVAHDEDALVPGIIARTAKILQDVPFVVNVATAHTLGGPLTLNDREAMNEQTTDSPALAVAKAVWRRSRWQEEVVETVQSTMMMGEGFVEVARMEGTPPYRVRLVRHDARSCRVQYNAMLDELVEARIVIMDQVADGVTNRRERILTRERVRVEVNGKVVEDRPHALGAVPLVHLRACPVVGDGQRHAVSVAHEIRPAIAEVDSAYSQSRAILTRNGNPILALTGARMPDGAPNPMQLGRVLNLPVGATANYITTDVDTVEAALQAAERIRSSYVSTMPEFLFSQLTSGESGEARRYRTDFFVQKYTAMRQRVIGALERATQYAVEMEEGKLHDPDRERFAINQPPVLALDIAKEINSLGLLRDKNLIRPADAVRKLQGFGYVPAGQDPEEYARLLGDDEAAAATTFFTPTPAPAQPDTPATDYP